MKVYQRVGSELVEMPQSDGGSVVIDVSSREAMEAAQAAQAQADANAAEIASVKEQTETAVNGLGESMASLATGLQATGEVAAQAKATAEAALPKAGGEVTGALHLYPVTFQKQPSADVNLTENRTARAYNQILFQDANNFNYGELGTYQEIDLTVVSKIQATNKKEDGTSVSAAINAVSRKDGTAYATCPPPRQNNYGSDIVNTKAMKDYAPMKGSGSVSIFVGGSNASDTADLFAGRGLSADKPFATIDAAIF